MSTLYVDNLQPNLGSRVMAAGHVVQVKSTTMTSTPTSTVTTFADTGLSITITPTSSTSKFLVMFDAGVASSSSAGGIIVRIVRDDGTATQLMHTNPAYTNTADSHYTACAVSHLDSPATTNDITYKIQFLAQTASATVYFNTAFGSPWGSPTANMTVMEIAQ